MYIFLLSFSTCMATKSRYCHIFFMMLMVQTSEYIEDSHHQYELSSLAAACGCACIYFIWKVVYCNKQPFKQAWQYGVFILNSCLYARPELSWKKCIAKTATQN